MLDVALGTIYLFLVLTLMGIGPALQLFKSVDQALAVAPTIGLTMTTIVGTYLVLFNYPISIWANSWLITSITISLLLAFYQSLKIKKIPQQNKNLFILFIGIITTTFLLLMPMLAGGLDFTTLRGNGSDTFNYLTLAGYLQHEPYSWAQTTNIQTLINKHPSYAWASELLITRWSTALLLGWTAILSHIPLYRFEYGFTALLFMLSFGCLFCLTLRLSIKAQYSLIIAIALCTGFWAQHLMDIRAMSQMSALPLTLLLAIQVIDIEENQNSLLRQTWLGIILAAIILLYTEMLTLIILGLLLFFLNQLLRQRQTCRTLIKKYFFALFILLVIVTPVAYNYLLRYLAFQMAMAVGLKNSWYQAYFNWLYSKPLLGFWGFSYLTFSKATHLILEFLSITLTSLFLYSIWRVIVSGKNISTAVNLIFAFVLSAFIEFTFLYFQGQLWSAAKALSFSYIFIFLFITAFILEYFPRLVTNRFLILAGKYTVLTWIFIQIGLGCYRIQFANMKTPYPDYITYHAEYRQHDWDITSLTKALEENNIQVVGIQVSNTWVSEYLAFAWGWDRQVINLNGIIDRSHNLSQYFALAWDWKKLITHLNTALSNTHDKVLHQTSLSLPEYLIVSSNHPLLETAEILARNNELVLIKVHSDSQKKSTSIQTS